MCGRQPTSTGVSSGSSPTRKPTRRRILWCGEINAAVHLARGEHTPTGTRIFFWVKDVNTLYEEVIQRGAAIAVPIETRPYRIRDFAIRDPNGVLLVYGQDWD